MKLLKSLALIMLASTAVVFSMDDADRDDTGAPLLVSAYSPAPTAVQDAVPVHASSMTNLQVRSALTALLASLSDEANQAELKDIIALLDVSDAAIVSTRLSALASTTSSEMDQTLLTSALPSILESLTTVGVPGVFDDDDDDSAPGLGGIPSGLAASGVFRTGADDTERTAMMIASLGLNGDEPPVPSAHVVADDDHGGETRDGAPASNDAIAEEEDDGGEDEDESGSGSDSDKAVADKTE